MTLFGALVVIDDYLTVTDLFSQPTTGHEPSPVGTYTGAKGRSVYLNIFEKIASLSLIELRPELGARGGHRHLRKTECFYLVSGRVRAEYWLEREPVERQVRDHQPGELIMIKPGLFHLFTPEEPSWAVEFSAHPHDLTDVASPQRPLL